MLLEQIETHFMFNKLYYVTKTGPRFVSVMNQHIAVPPNNQNTFLSRLLTEEQWSHSILAKY